ncbi:suppressor of fused domain protein [Tsukamurella sp. 8F]|nr:MULTISPECIES: suppressor of fused domain protein [unclassified Tsukamurella]MDF0530348.1 suppressor of fused domain protein [Tsukamurella sp. 8J]MDF0587645.1 suppressor of fused domain protein [Tsukamurella sp. 8F]
MDRVREHLLEYQAQRGFDAPVSASLTFLGVEPVEVMRWAGVVEGVPTIVFASVGCSRHAMTDPSDFAPSDDGPRAEVLLELTPRTPDQAELRGAHRTVALLAASPAVEGLVLGPDALVDLSAPLWEGAPFTAVLLAESDVPDLSIPAGSQVCFLRAVPITANEAAWVRLKGADALREAWAEASIDPADPARAAANQV